MALALGTTTLAAGLVVILVTRSAFRAATRDPRAELPGSASLQPLAPVVLVIAALIGLVIVGSTAAGVVPYGDRPQSAVDAGTLAQSSIFALFVAALALPPLTIVIIAVIGVEQLGLRLGIARGALRIGGGTLVALATFALVVGAGWYIALATWAAIPVAAGGGLAMARSIPHQPRATEG